MKKYADIYGLNKALQEENFKLKDKLCKCNVQIKRLQVKIEELKNPLINPYLLSGKELNRAERARKEGC